jgi:hypothetical protein
VCRAVQGLGALVGDSAELGTVLDGCQALRDGNCCRVCRRSTLLASLGSR